MRSFPSGKYITEVYIIEQGQYVNRLIITRNYVLCTQITFTFLWSLSLWTQKPHKPSALTAPRSPINSSGSPGTSLAVQVLQHRKRVTEGNSHMFSFPSHVFADPACLADVLHEASSHKIGINTSMVFKTCFQVAHWDGWS